MTASTDTLLDLNTITLPALYRHLAGTGLVERILVLARDEDLAPEPLPAGRGDVTTRCALEPARTVRAEFVCREHVVVAGTAVLPTLLHLYDDACRYEPLSNDGDRLEPGQTIGVIEGPAQAVLGAERPALNLLARLCGVAMLTAKFAAETQGTAAHIYDTRKTTPGLRVLEKYAVRCGGGRCHRLGLHDAVLLKDNHLAAMDTIHLRDALAEAAKRARADRPLRFVMVEADTLQQLETVLHVEPGHIDTVLLDNMQPNALRRAVEMRDAVKSTISLEASGGVTLQRVKEIAETGVDRISVGAITRSAIAPDIGVDTIQSRTAR